MDFGHVSLAQLDRIDFHLPQEPLQNKEILKGRRIDTPKIYLGCPRWGVKEWVGKLYPKGTKDAHFLDEYIKQFNCIELNSTFYNLYDEATIERWAAKPEGHEFKFCPKVFQGISHEGHLSDKLPLMHAFEKSVAAFGNYLGPCFLQLSDAFGPDRQKELFHFLQGVSSDLFLFVEVRHQGWFEKKELENLVGCLKELNKALIITDTAGRRDVCHMHVSNTKLMVRFVANNLHPTDYTRADEWVKRIAYWLNQGLHELYFMVHMTNEKHSPELAGYLIDKLNAACGLNLKKPFIVQGELF